MNAAEPIVIVSGLPRSGTSMMMGMLAAGGIAPVQDGVRTADEDNPKGYFELERVKQLAADDTWLDGCAGKTVKVISQLLLQLPTDRQLGYKVIFMRRDLDEVLASQKKMLIRRGTYDPGVADDEIRSMFLLHIDQVTTFLRTHACFDTLFVNYNLMLANPAARITQVNNFLGGRLDTQAMGAVVDKNLYRNRAAAGDSPAATP